MTHHAKPCVRCGQLTEAPFFIIGHNPAPEKRPTRMKFGPACQDCQEEFRRIMREQERIIDLEERDR